MLDQLGLAPDLPSPNIAPTLGNENCGCVIRRGEFAFVDDQLVLVEDDESISLHVDMMRYRTGP